MKFIQNDWGARFKWIGSSPKNYLFKYRREQVKIFHTYPLFFFFIFTSNFHEQFSSVQSLSRVWLFATPWAGAHQASLSITKSQSPPKPMSIELVMPSNILSKFMKSNTTLYINSVQNIFEDSEGHYVVINYIDTYKSNMDNWQVNVPFSPD